MTLKGLVSKAKIDAIKAAIRARGAGAAEMTLDEMATAIGTIGGGSAPSGTISITENGTYDVAAYASAAVNVSSGGGISVEKTVTTHGEDWTTSANGNTLKFYNTYFDSTYQGAQIAIITNNTASGNKGHAAFIFYDGTTRYGACQRGNNDGKWFPGYSNFDFFIASGSVITLYKIPFTAFQ